MQPRPSGSPAGDFARRRHAALLDARQRAGIAGAESIDAVAVVLRTSSAECNRAGQHRHHAARAGSRASVTASSRFCGPSRNSAVAGRIAAASTTGFAGASRRWEQ